MQNVEQIEKSEVKISWCSRLHVYINVISTFILATCVFLQMREIYLRSNIGFGLTDEAYGISFTLDRAINGQLGVTPIYTDVTSYMLKLANFDLQTFRLIGFATLFLVSLIFYATSRKMQPNSNSKIVKIWLFLLVVFVILFITSSFRYLLVTPSYQWFVMIAGVLICCLVLFESQVHSWAYSQLILFLVAGLITLSLISRPTSGLVTLTITSTYVFLTSGEERIKKTIFLIACFILIIACYFLFNRSSTIEYLIRYWNMRNLDPKGSSLLNEIWDVLRAFLSFALLMWSSSWIMKAFRQKIAHQKLGKHEIALGLIICCLTIVFVSTTLQYKGLEHLVAFGIVCLFGMLHAAQFSNRISYKDLVFCSLPLVSQFGSNINASYLVVPFILSASLFTYATKQSQSVLLDSTKQTEFRGIKSLLNLTLTILLLVIQDSSLMKSYETDLPNKALAVDSRTNLMFSKEKILAIQEFRTNANLNNFLDSIRVVDFSFWHPGVILYLGALQFPSTTLDYTFRGTIDRQVEQILIDLQKPQFQTNLFIVRTLQKDPTNSCKRLSEHMIDVSIVKSLLFRNFDPYLREVSIYRSSPIDLTLHPRNIALLQPC